MAGRIERLEKWLFESQRVFDSIEKQARENLNYCREVQTNIETKKQSIRRLWQEIEKLKREQEAIKAYQGELDKEQESRTRRRSEQIKSQISQKKNSVDVLQKEAKTLLSLLRQFKSELKANASITSSRAEALSKLKEGFSEQEREVVQSMQHFDRITGKRYATSAATSASMQAKNIRDRCREGAASSQRLQENFANLTERLQAAMEAIDRQELVSGADAFMACNSDKIVGVMAAFSMVSGFGGAMVLGQPSEKPYIQDAWLVSMTNTAEKSGSVLDTINAPDQLLDDEKRKEDRESIEVFNAGRRKRASGDR